MPGSCTPGSYPNRTPLRAKINQEAGRLKWTLTHECSIGKLLVNFEVDPTREPKLEQAAPSDSPTQPYIALGGKEEAIEDEKRCTSAVKIYTDGSMVDGHVGAAAVLLGGGREVAVAKRYVGTDKEHGVYEAEVIGLLLGMELLAREQGVGEATFFIDNQAVLSTLQKGQTNNVGCLFEHLDEPIRLARERNRGIKLKTCWILGHADVTGNERADDKAKLASADIQPTDELLPLSLGGEISINPSVVKRVRRAGMVLNWKTWTREEKVARRTETHKGNRPGLPIDAIQQRRRPTPTTSTSDDHPASNQALPDPELPASIHIALPRRRIIRASQKHPAAGVDARGPGGVGPSDGFDNV